VSYEPAPKLLPPDWSVQTESILLSVNLASCGRISTHSNAALSYKSVDPGAFLDLFICLLNNSNYKAIVDYTSPALCIAVTPSCRQVMLPILNMPEEDCATDIGNMHKNLVKIARVIPKISLRTDRQTHRQTYSSQYFTTAPACEVIIKVVKVT